MPILLSGLLIWALVHFTSSLFLPLKKLWQKTLGMTGHKISFSLAIILSIVLMVVGWKQTTPTLVYTLPYFFKHIAVLLMLVAVTLFGAARRPSNIKMFVRHPQLISIIIWAIAHLLTNGDSRSIVLFGGLGIWACAEIILINHRDGAWKKPGPVGWKKETIGVVVTLLIFFGLMFAHEYFSGVPLHSL